MSVAELRELERRYLVPTYVRAPVEFVRGSGALLYDADGNEYLDMLCGIGVTNLGHCHPAVVAAVREQAGELLHVSNLFYTAPAMELAAELSAASLDGKVFFCNSGAEANEAAIKLARRARPRGTIVVLHGGFHGRTYGALSATAQELKQAPFAPLVPGFVAVPADGAALTAAVDGDTAAVLLETIQGEAGVHVVAEEVLRAARDACDAHGAALIVDEVQTGMGRTGELFSYQATGVVPDAITAAKALGGGLPIGALITGPRLADALGPGDHGSTFAGGPLVARAALAALRATRDERLLAHVRDAGARLSERLAALDGVLAVRGRGLMIALDVAGDAPALAARALGEQRLVINATGPATLRLLPPLIADEEQLADAADRLGAVLAG